MGRSPPPWMMLTYGRRWSSVSPPETLFHKGLLQRYLLQLLFKLAIPAARDSRDMYSQLNTPLTLVSWIRVLCYLTNERKYPKHWMSDVVDSVLSGSVETAAKPFYASPFPQSEAAFPNRTPQKFCTQPFVPELKVLLRQMKTLIPFTIATPLPSTDELGYYKLNFDIYDREAGPVKEVLGLIFTAPTISKGDINPRMLTRKDSEDRVVWVTSFEWLTSWYVKLGDRMEARFCLEKSEVERMKEAGWKAWILRIDTWKVLVRDSSEVKEVEEEAQV